MMLKNHVFIFCTLIIICDVYAAVILKNLQRYESLRFGAINATRKENLDFGFVDEELQKVIPFFHVVLMMPFTGSSVTGEDPPVRSELTLGVYQGMVAFLLALEHLNSADGSIVPQLYGLDGRCPLKFTAEVVDTGLDVGSSVRKTMNITARRANKPGGILGAYRSQTTIPISIIAAAHKILQISPYSSSTELKHSDLYLTFGRTVPSDEATARMAVQYIRYQLGATHLAVIYVNDEYGKSYASQLSVAGSAEGVHVAAFDFPFHAPQEGIERAVANLKKTSYRYIMAIFFEPHYASVMTEAYRQGIAGDGAHNWLFTDSIGLGYLASDYVQGSPLYLATRGAHRVIFAAGDPDDGASVAFGSAMNGFPRSPPDLAYIEGKHPIGGAGADAEDFRDSFEGIAPFVYDAMVAMGLSGCEAWETAGGGAFDGVAHYAALLNTTFDGASGPVAFDSNGSREPSSAQYEVQVFVHEDVKEPLEIDAKAPDCGVAVDQGSGTKVRLKAVAVARTIGSDWAADTVKGYALFNDGCRTVPPPDLPPVVGVNYNYLGAWAFAPGALVMGLSAVAAAWACLSNCTFGPDGVQWSAPVFLLAVCSGCLLMGAACITLALDDERVPLATLGVTCAVTPWFITFGWAIAYAALYAKARSLGGASPQGVAAPIRWRAFIIPGLVVAYSAIALLLVTVVRRPVWLREPTASAPVDKFGRPTESVGYCSFAFYSVGSWEFVFVVILGLAYLAWQLLALYEARTIGSEPGEGGHVSLLLYVLIAVFVVGILAVAVAWGRTNAPKVAAMAVLCAAVLAHLCFIFIPRCRCCVRVRQPEAAREPAQEAEA